MINTLRFFSSSKCSLFHNSNVFDSCIIHILYTGVLTFKKNNSGAKRLSSSLCSFLHSTVTSSVLGPNMLLSTLLTNRIYTTIQRYVFRLIKVTEQTSTGALNKNTIARAGGRYFVLCFKLRR